MTAKEKSSMTLEDLAELMVGELHDLRQGQDQLRQGVDELRQGVDELRQGQDDLRQQIHELTQGHERLVEEVRAMRGDIHDILHRLDLLEERSASHAGFAKEIDELRARVDAMQKELDALSTERHVRR